MNKSLLKVVIFVFCISFIMAWLRPNAMEEIGRLQAYVLNGVPESEGYHPAWEWEMSLDTVGTLSVDYKTEYLRKDVPFIALYFSNDSKDIGIGVTINLSEQDKVGLEMGANYYYEEKTLVYNPIYVWKESDDLEVHVDEKQIDEYLSKYGLTRKDVKEYQEYAIYDVIVKTWSKAYMRCYWLEKWKLKFCDTVDNTFKPQEGKGWPFDMEE